MLERLLVELKGGGTLTPFILAERLNIRVEMVKALLDQLARMGLIQNFKTDCGETTCHGCSLDSLCKKPTTASPKIWTFSHPSYPGTSKD